MLKDKLTIYAEKGDAERINALVYECVEKSDINMVDIVAVSDSYKEEWEIPASLRCAVLPEGLSVSLPAGVRKLTYSVNSTKGDIAALNVQKRSQCTCFEVLYGVFMSRVFIPDESLYTPFQIIMCVSILCGWGASVEKLIPLINEILK